MVEMTIAAMDQQRRTRLRRKSSVTEGPKYATTPKKPMRPKARLSAPLYNGHDADPTWAASLTAHLQKKVRSGCAGLPWPRDRASALVRDATALMERQEPLVRLNLPSTARLAIIGDIHGQLNDLIRVLQMHGPPSEDNQYLFNGDFVDRGPNSVEVLLVLYAWKVAAPDYVHLNRGNHEDHALNVSHGFFHEVMAKYDHELYYAFQMSFKQMPVAHLINGRVLVVHGGLPRNMAPIEDIAKLEREDDPIEPPSLMHDLLWSDPHEGVVNFGPNEQRGGDGVVFGPAATRKYLEENNLTLLIRSHQRKQDGFDVSHEGLCVTVFSASDYMGSGNGAALLVLSGIATEPVEGGKLLRSAGELGDDIGALVVRILEKTEGTPFCTPVKPALPKLKRRVTIAKKQKQLFALQENQEAGEEKQVSAGIEVEVEESPRVLKKPRRSCGAEVGCPPELASDRIAPCAIACN